MPWLTPSAPQEAIPPAPHCLMGFGGSDGFPHMDRLIRSVQGGDVCPWSPLQCPGLGEPSCPDTRWQRDGSA